MASWNDRFHLTNSVANRESCSFYRQYFDKPSRKTYRTMFQPKRSLRRRLVQNGQISNKSKLKAKSIGGARYASTGRSRNSSWDEKFHILPSANNEQTYTGIRDYFSLMKPSVSITKSNRIRKTQSTAHSRGSSRTPTPTTRQRSRKRSRSGFQKDYTSSELHWNDLTDKISMHNKEKHRLRRAYFDN